MSCSEKWSSTSVARLGNLLHFGQLFKACGNNYFAQIAHTLGNFCKGVKIFLFLAKFFLGNFYRHLAIFFWSHCPQPPPPQKGRNLKMIAFAQSKVRNPFFSIRKSIFIEETAYPNSKWPILTCVPNEYKQALVTKTKKCSFFTFVTIQ